jgi:hypothetical protein
VDGHKTPFHRRTKGCRLVRAGMEGSVQRLRGHPTVFGSAPFRPLDPKDEQFTRTPDMVSQSVRHRRRDGNLSPTMVYSGCSTAQLMMQKAEAVGTANYPHVSLEAGDLSSRVAAPPDNRPAARETQRSSARQTPYSTASLL